MEQYQLIYRNNDPIKAEYVFSVLQSYGLDCQIQHNHAGAFTPIGISERAALVLVQKEHIPKAIKILNEEGFQVQTHNWNPLILSYFQKFTKNTPFVKNWGLRAQIVSAIFVVLAAIALLISALLFLMSTN